MKYLILLFPFACNAIEVSWDAPTEREQCILWGVTECIEYTPLPPDEIAGYLIEVLVDGEWIDVMNGVPYQGNSVSIGPNYAYRLRTMDIDGRTSAPSVVFFEDLTPDPPVIQCN